MNSFLLDNFIFDIVLLLFDVVVARTDNLGKGLASEGRLPLVLPELTSLCLREEGLRLLANELAIGVLLEMLGRLLFNRDDGGIGARARVLVFILDVFHIGHL